MLFSSIFFLINLKEFLHITDIHLDLSYTTHSPTNCLLGNTGLRCCHKYDIPRYPNKPAGKWGDTNCDVPSILLNDTLGWISNNYPHLDFILYSGDSVGHHDIDQSVDKNIETMQYVTDIFNYHFKDTLVIPNQGNHDTYPIDQTIPLLEERIRKRLASNWETLLDKNISNTFIEKGYFKLDNIPISNQDNNITIISINSLEYDSHNVFRTSEKDKIDWLNKTLYEERMKGNKVFILGHIFPTGGESTPIYNKYVLEYLEMYNDIIVGSFFGHSHHDEFKIKDKINPILVTPSLMPDNRDPCFRIYQYTTILLDYKQYCIDLDTTNTLNTLQVYLDYSFQKEYGLANITYDSYKLLLNQLKKNTTLALIYCKHYFNKKCNISQVNSLISNIEI